MTPFVTRRAALRASVAIWTLFYLVSVVLMKGMKYGGRLQATAASIPTKEDSHSSHSDEVQIPLMFGMEKQSESPSPEGRASSESIEEDEKVGGDHSEKSGKPLDEDAPTTQVPSSENVRSLIGDLEACENNLDRLGEYKGRERDDHGLSVSANQLDSCKETISTLLQWLAPQRNRSSISLCSVVSNASASKNGARPNIASEGKLTAQDPQPQIKNNLLRQRATVIKSNSGSADERTLRCKETACDTMKDLPSLCSTPERTNSKITGLCAMCFPRNEDLIDLYCQRSSGPDTPTLVILGGLLITVSAAAAILIGIRHVRARSGTGAFQKESGTQGLPISSRNGEQRRSRRYRLWGQPLVDWVKQMFGRFGRRNRRSSDVEDSSLPVARESRVDTQIPLNYDCGDGGASDRYGPQQGEFGTVKCPKIRGLASAPRIPVMPRARSSSVQIPSRTATNPSSTASKLTGRDGTAQRLPTVYTSSPTRCG